MPPKLKIEIFIPTLYNPNENGIREPIETRKRRYVKNYIVNKYKGISIHPQTVQGVWVNPSDGKRYFDNCYRYEVCIDPKEEIDRELENWKEKLKELFKQFEIYMNYYEVTQI